MTNKKIATICFNIDQQCPIQNVTVYNNRAEVTRHLRHHFSTEGTYDLIFEGFSPFVDLTSLHVSGGSSKTCAILEVSYRTFYESTTSQTDLSPFDQLRIEFDKVEADLSAHERELDRLGKQRIWIDGRAQKFMNEERQLNSNDLDAIYEFMDFYHKVLRKLDDRKVNEENEIKRLLQERDALRIKMSEYTIEDQLNNPNERRELTITVHVGGYGIDFSLDISYLIGNCSWSASYDVRINSVEIYKPRTQVTYYGIVINKSQENWSDVQLSLSTAAASLKGIAPILPTLKINYYQPCHNYYQLGELENKADDCSEKSAQICLSMDPISPLKKSRGLGSSTEQSSLHSNQVLVEDEEEPSNINNFISTTTDTGIVNASFNIPRRSTIDADGKPHKVTISVLDLTSTFIYTVVPKLSVHAYLKVSTINTSDKQLLAGPVSVFMDNNFITHSSIKHVYLGDKFDLPLGTDAGIKVESKPVKKITDTQGLISKTYYENIRRETRLVNTKSTEVIVYVYEQVPLPLDEKIKVKVIVPDLRMKEQSSCFSVTMNEQNNLEWKCILPARGECRLPLEYTLEWPMDKRIECKEE